MAKLTLEQLAALTPADLAALDSKTIERLSPLELSRLPPETFQRWVDLVTPPAPVCTPFQLCPLVVDAPALVRDERGQLVRSPVGRALPQFVDYAGQVHRCAESREPGELSATVTLKRGGFRRQFSTRERREHGAGGGRKVLEAVPQGSAIDWTENILPDADARREWYARHPFSITPDRYQFTPSPSPPGFTFYLGAPEIGWVGRTNVPLFLQMRRLFRPQPLTPETLKFVQDPEYRWDPRMPERKTYRPMQGGQAEAARFVLVPALKSWPQARGPWALDSGGFSFVGSFAGYPIGPEGYARWYDFLSGVVGNLEWAAVQDYMCEPDLIAAFGVRVGLTEEERARATTALEAANRYWQFPSDLAFKLQGPENVYDLTWGAGVYRHQLHTVESWERLAEDELPMIPVLQGWTEKEYRRCFWMYQQRGADLPDEPRVGIGSVCRRQDTQRAQIMINSLAAREGLRMHGFGFKIAGLPAIWRNLRSSDSMAWSTAARRMQGDIEAAAKKAGRAKSDWPKLIDDYGTTMRNSLRWGLVWRERLLALLALRSDEDTTFIWGGQRRNSVDLRTWREEQGLPPAELVVEQTSRTNWMRFYGLNAGSVSDEDVMADDESVHDDSLEDD